VASREVKVNLKVDVAEFAAAGHGNPNANPGLRTAICDWLRDNGIDPALVPADERPDCSYRDGEGVPLGGHTITTRVRVRVAPEGGGSGLIIRYGANRLEETTITKPMKVPPPLIVQKYLDAKCPTCGR
jgi:hypothetical protein